MSTPGNPDASPPHPPQQWYCKRAAGPDGPWSSERLLAEIAAGRVTPDDLVKTDAMPEWVAAKSVNGLAFPDTPAPTPPGRTNGPPPLPANSPPLPPKPRPKSVPPTLPGRRPRADASRPRPVIWGYVGGVLVVLTVGLGVAAVALKDRERADGASSADTARSPDPANTARPTPTQPTTPSDGAAIPARPRPDTGSSAVLPPPPPKSAEYRDLFPGWTLNGWVGGETGKPARWKVVPGEYVEVAPGSGNIRTLQEFKGNYVIQLEFWLPPTPGKRGQQKANSKGIRPGAVRGPNP
jgi:hypothetical protein